MKEELGAQDVKWLLRVPQEEVPVSLGSYVLIVL